MWPENAPLSRLQLPLHPGDLFPWGPFISVYSPSSIPTSGPLVLLATPKLRRQRRWCSSTVHVPRNTRFRPTQSSTSDHPSSLACMCIKTTTQQRHTATVTCKRLNNTPVLKPCLLSPPELKGTVRLARAQQAHPAAAMPAPCTTNLQSTESKYP